MVTRRPLVRIAGRTRQLPDGDQLDLPVGSSPDQLPAGTHLGALAFVDDLGALTVLRHTPDSVPGLPGLASTLSGATPTERYISSPALTRAFDTAKAARQNNLYI